MARWIFRVVVLLLILYGLAEYNRRRATLEAECDRDLAAVTEHFECERAKAERTHAEAFQAVVWHLLVSHPKLKRAQTKWESTK